MFSCCLGWRIRARTSAFGRKQPFRQARKSQLSAQPYPIWRVTQDSSDTVRLGRLEWLSYSILSGCCGAESVAGLSRIRRGRIYSPLIKRSVSEGCMFWEKHENANFSQFRPPPVISCPLMPRSAGTPVRTLSDCRPPYPATLPIHLHQTIVIPHVLTCSYRRSPSTRPQWQRSICGGHLTQRRCLNGMKKLDKHRKKGCR